MKMDVLEFLEKKPSRYILVGLGGWGRASTGCNLSAGDFVTLRPLEERLHRREDVREIGHKYAKWVPDGKTDSGKRKVYLKARYRLSGTYRFDHHAYRDLCRKACRRHEDPDMPWNWAIGGPIEASLDFTLR